MVELWFLWRLTRLRHRLEKDPSTRHYTDIAIRPLENELAQMLRLYEATEGARKVATKAHAAAQWLGSSGLTFIPSLA